MLFPLPTPQPSNLSLIPLNLGNDTQEQLESKGRAPEMNGQIKDDKGDTGRCGVYGEGMAEEMWRGAWGRSRLVEGTYDI